jgi:2,4-dienoyl-CoA reductase-like NADH-dependent reductase (Old Yellow Enzyme family)
MIETPLTLRCGLALSNRLVKASLTEGLSDARRDPGDAYLQLYRRWSRSGAGLMLTGNVVLDPMHSVRPGDIVVGPESSKPALRAWAEVCKSGGTCAMVQVNHAGRQTMLAVNPKPLAPSAVAAVKMLKAFGRPYEASLEEIADVIKRFGKAAEVLEEAGFDGVQVHAAHGYLLNQFLSPLSNRRTDRYGGSVENRARALIEAVREVRSRVSRSFAVAVKLNSADFQRGGFTEDESLQVVKLLENEGLDFIELSGGTYEQPASFGHKGEAQVATRSSTREREAYFLSFARRVRQQSKMPLMVTGGFRHRGAMAEAIAEGAVDLIGLGRPMALQPDLPRQLLSGEVEASAPLPSRWGRFRELGGAAELAWYGAQLERMSVGLEPDPNLPVWSTLFRSLWSDTRRGFSQRKNAKKSEARAGRGEPSTLVGA